MIRRSHNSEAMYTQHLTISLQIQQQPETWRECTVIQLNNSGKTGSKAMTKWIWSAFRCLELSMQWKYHSNDAIINTRHGQSRHLRPTSIISVHVHRGLRPARLLCSAEVAAMFTYHCTLKHLWKSQKSYKNGQEWAISSRCELGKEFSFWSTKIIGALKNQWLDETALLTCLAASIKQ